MKNAHRKSTRRSISSRTGRKSERPRVEVSAGGLVYKRTRRGIYFAMLKDSFGKWTFPKGHVRRGETHNEAAEREVFEEMGLKGLQMRKRLGTIDIWFRDRFVFKGKLIHKFIHYYLFEVPRDAKLRKPKPADHGERIQGVQWVPLAEVKKRSTYKDMKGIIREALLQLEKEDQRKKKPRVDRRKQKA